MTRRVLLLIGFVAAAGLVRWQTAATPVATDVALEALPFDVGEWQGRRGTEFGPDVVAALGVDDYVNRAYVADGGRQANVYVGYHRAQEHGSSVHSPLNCMPGSGWELEQVERVAFGAGHVRRVLIRKGAQRLLVVYWYQTATRVEGDEYRARFHAVLDTMRAGRNDAALVRVMVPVAPDPEGEPRAAQQAFELAGLVLPHVDRLLFSRPPIRSMARAD